jgi:hypothetical protein
MMIRQGYVPETCTLDDQLAGPLIWEEVNAGRDPCAGCAADRSICHGRPGGLSRIGVSDILTPAEKTRVERREWAEQNGYDVTSPWEEIK